MPRTIHLIPVFAILFALTAHADAPPASVALCSAEISNQLERAFAVRNWTWHDLAFEKDIAAPTQVMNIARTVLQDPMALPAFADRTLEALTDEDRSALWTWAGELLEERTGEPTPPAAAPGGGIAMPSVLDPALSNALSRLLSAAMEAQSLLDYAFADVPREDRQYAAAAILADLLDASEQPDVRPALIHAGLPETLLDQVQRESESLDPSPANDRLLSVIARIRFSALLHAAQRLEQAASACRSDLAHVSHWPETMQLLSTECGPIVIGTLLDDTYSENAFLLLDPGGNDHYLNTGAANGLLDRPLSLVIDLSGRDFYDDSGIPACGMALWGLSFCLDAQGNDIRRTAYSGQAAALFGVALLSDLSGDDQYIAGAFAQCAALAGLAILEDAHGNDTYTLSTAGQSYAGVGGVAALIDRNGNDLYTAGRTRPDADRHWRNYLSLAQGFSIGMRPIAGGGVAILLDQSGNDTYSADVYAQGVGYWYSIGMLLDLHGHDNYRLHEYGQGCGVHLSAGLLADSEGRDTYTAYSLAQGAAHDYAVGMLFEQEGSDTYTADHFAQGRGINNALGFLIDSRGEDAYFARRSEACQGAGHYSDFREYDSLSLLLDLADEDVYSSGASNGVPTLRPDFGLICDVATNLPLATDVPQDTMPPPDLTQSTLDELMTAACRFGNTEERRVTREAAFQEFKRRGDPALNYLLQHADGNNAWYMIYADRMVRENPAEISAPTLLHTCNTTTNELIRKYALLLLGFHETPQYAEQIMHGLTNEITAGATIRTLGKWKITNAVEQITPFLQNTNERKRIIAVNALRDMGETNALPALQPLLNDPLFTVRQSAERAITTTNTLK